MRPIGVRDAARVNHISERTVRRWIGEGRLATVKRDGVTHVDALEVEVMAAESRENRHERSARPGPLAT